MELSLHVVNRVPIPTKQKQPLYLIIDKIFLFLIIYYLHPQIFVALIFSSTLSIYLIQNKIYYYYIFSL
jgi:hypothetical protein